MPSVVAFPSITPNVTEAGIITNSKQFVSPLTGYTQTASRKGGRWMMRMVFNNLQGSSRRVLQGYLNFMEGQVNRIETIDHSYTGALGALGVNIEVDGANQTGTTLNIKEVSAGTSTIANFLKAGDLICFSNGTYYELKQVTSDTDLSSGTASVPIAPEIHTSPADAQAVETGSFTSAITSASWSYPVGTFMLVSPVVRWGNRPGQVSGSSSPFSDFTVELMEDIGT